MKKLLDVKILSVDGDVCRLKYTLDYGRYLRRVSDTYSFSSGELSKGILKKDENFLFLFKRALDTFGECYDSLEVC